MKRILFLIVVSTVIISINVCVATTIQPIDAPIKKVTVYPDRALIVRTAEYKFNAGDQSVSIENLPKEAIDESFRVSASGGTGLILLGMKHSVEFHTESPQTRVTELTKMIDRILKYDKQPLMNRMDAYQKQRELLLSFIKSIGETTTDQVNRGFIPISQWDEAYNFIGTRINTVNDSIRLTQYKIDSISNVLQTYQSELDLLHSSNSNETKTVQIDLRLTQSGTVIITLEYVIPGATWVPIYDARLEIDSNYINLSYDAEVSQHTGEDWNNVDLTLSTAMTSQGTGPGDFIPRFFFVNENFETSNQQVFAQRELKSKKNETVNDLLGQVSGVETSSGGNVYIRGGRAGEVAYVVDETPTGPATIPGSIVGVNDYSTTFAVQRKETISSGDKSVRTSIGRYKLKADLQFICRPKNANGVYRIANITNQEQVPLMPGRAAIFVGADYLGEAYIPGIVSPNEKYDLPFGCDNNFKVEQKVVFEKKTVSSDKIKNDATIKITLRNLSKITRSIKLEDALPTTKDSRIKIVLGDINPKPLSTDESGKAIWNFDITAGDSTSVTIPYSISYPAYLQIIGQ